MPFGKIQMPFFHLSQAPFGRIDNTNPHNTVPQSNPVLRHTKTNKQHSRTSVSSPGLKVIAFTQELSFISPSSFSSMHFL
jgi:hypothetical protein